MFKAKKAASMVNRGAIIERLMAGKTDDELEKLRARLDAFCGSAPRAP